MKKLNYLSLIFVSVSVFAAMCTNSALKSELSMEKKSNNPIVEDSIESEDFNHFWEKFRNAIINMDTSFLINSSKFPIKCYGNLDSDGFKQIKKEDFIKTLNIFLTSRCSEGCEFDFIKKIADEKFYDSNIGSDDYRRMGNLIFLIDNGNWKLIEIYINSDLLKNLP